MGSASAQSQSMEVLSTTRSATTWVGSMIGTTTKSRQRPRLCQLPRGMEGRHGLYYRVPVARGMAVSNIPYFSNAARARILRQRFYHAMGALDASLGT